MAMAKKKKMPKVSHVADGNEREAALRAAMSQLDKQFGAGTVMRLGDVDTTQTNLDVISTGSLTLDDALVVGGLPTGRVVEIYGPESSGKTTLALHVIAQAQKEGRTCCFIDVEHAMDLQYAEKLGVKQSELLFAQPDSGEQALEVADTLVRSGTVDVIVVDSVAALVPRAEIEGEMGDQQIALQARLMSQALRKLTPSLASSKTLLIFINQVRHKVGVMFGSPDVTSGGNALKFYSSVRMEIRRTGQIKGATADDIVGHATRVKIIKNKLGAPHRIANFDLMFNKGIALDGELVDAGAQLGLLQKSGAWYAFSDEGYTALVEALGGMPPAAAEAAAPAEEAEAEEAEAEPAAKPRRRRKTKKQLQAEQEAAEASADEAEAHPEAQIDPLAGIEPGAPFAQGRDKAKAWFSERPMVMDAFRDIVLPMMKEARQQDF